MFAFFVLPALLGLALIVEAFDDDDNDNDSRVEDLETDDPKNPLPPSVESVPDDQAEFTGTDAGDYIQARDAGGVISAAGGDDTVLGSDASDQLFGGEGSDDLDGAAGDDNLMGGEGGDFINGGDGGDTINGDSGEDTIFAGTGNDVAIGGIGNDRVFLGDGSDIYLMDEENGTGDEGDDFIRGGAGKDLIVDLKGSNELFGDVGGDALATFDGLNDNGVYSEPDEIGTTDTLSGGYGDDVLAGDHGDVMTGGEGQDTFITLDDEDAAIEEIIVTDFSTNDDELVIGTLFGLADQGSIGLEYDNALDAVKASYEGRTVAILQGLTAVDIPNINVSVTPLDDL